jgi:adenosine kinase
MSTKKYTFLTTGYVSMDHIIKIKTPARVGFTSLVENASNSTIHYGGCSVNIATALSKLGLPSVPIIRVGDDWIENGFKEILEKEQVPLVGITHIKGENTSTSYLLEDNNGDHITIFYPGAMDEKYANEIDDDLFTQAEYGVITVGTKEDNAQFAHRCMKYNLPIIFGMKGDLDAFSKDFLLEILMHSKIIFTNESERETIEHMFQLTSLTDLFDTTKVDVIVTTHGKKGSFYYTTDQREGKWVKAYDLFERVDTTGCGDAYISGFLFGYAQHYSVETCCLLGSLLSSFVLAKMGCCTNLPTKDQLLEAYNSITSGGTQ